MPDNEPGPDPASVENSLKAARRPAPTAADEAYDIRIARDGTWYYQGTPIPPHRLGLVRLFATVLRRDEAGDYWLITPAERGRIQVDDAPFTAVELTAEGSGGQQVLHFRTNLNRWIEAGPDHPIRVAFADDSDEPSPYIRVVDRLEALIVRSVYYQLVELAVEQDGCIGVWSKATFFPLDRPRDRPLNRPRDQPRSASTGPSSGGG